MPFQRTNRAGKKKSQPKPKKLNTKKTLRVIKYANFHVLNYTTHDTTKYTTRLKKLKLCI